MPITAGAEETGSTFDQLAAGIIESSQPRWSGVRVPHPSEQPRPNVATTLRSQWWSVTVHAAPGVSQAHSQRALAALEHASAVLSRDGWPAAPPDGDLGGDSDFDLYLVAKHPPSSVSGTAHWPAEAHADAPIHWSFLDRVSSFGVAVAAASEANLVDCAIDAYVQAILLSTDPAESLQARRATAAWWTWRLTGNFGCQDAVEQEQSEPWRSPIDGSAQAGAGGALWLQYLDESLARGDGSFVQNAWQVAQQRTWEGGQLRGSPNLWQSLSALLLQRGESLTLRLADYAAWRHFTALGQHGRQQLAWLSRVDIQQLPQRTAVAIPALESFGSAYAMVRTPTGSAPSQVQVWLRGEYGAQWSLEAIRCDARGHALSRLSAPARDTPKSYLPITLTPDTAFVLLVITRVDQRWPLQAVLPRNDEVPPSYRTFSLILGT